MAFVSSSADGQNMAIRVREACQATAEKLRKARLAQSLLKGDRGDVYL